MGRFVREQLEREGVDTRAVVTDGARLTSLVLLAVQGRESFPLIFYRENCADAALAEEDIAQAFIASARGVLVTGTHFSLPGPAAAQRKAVRIARGVGSRVILDIDYRPNLWGIGGHDSGEARYARSARVTAALAPVLPECDLIVGTEEELHVAAGAEDTLEAVRRIRARSQAVIVCKRGPQGCIVFAADIPHTLEAGLVVGGREIAVYNVLGAGDAFLAGFLSGYLRGVPHAVSAERANACGAIAVSRLLCSSEFATSVELEHYLACGSAHRTLRHDPVLARLHRAGTRRPAPAEILALALDELPAQLDEEQGAHFAQRALNALAQAAPGHAAGGMLLGPEIAVSANDAQGRWLARRFPVSSPADDGGQSLALALTEWPVWLTAAWRCEPTSGTGAVVWPQRGRELTRLSAVCAAQGRELLADLSYLAARDSAETLARVYALGIYPDWWLLPAQADAAAWQECAELIARADPYCRGVLLAVGCLDPVQLQLAARLPCVRGIVVAHAILGDAPQAWAAGQMSAELMVQQIAERLKDISNMWASHRHPAGAAHGGKP